MAILAPNPVRDLATVSLLLSGHENDILPIQIHDSKGQLMLQLNEVNKISETIQMSSLADGFYFITIMTTNSNQVLKAVVSRN